VTDTPEAAAVVETPAPEQTEDQAMEAAWERLHQEDAPAEVSTEAVAEDAPKEAEPGEDAAKEPLAVVEAPTDLPAELRERWSSIPEDARGVILATQRELAGKLATQGRLFHGIKPIHDAVLRATREIPSLNDFTPEQVADKLFALGKIEGDFVRNPVQTLLGLAQQAGAIDQLKAALNGEPAPAAQAGPLIAKISALEAQVQKLSNPDTIRAEAQAAVQETEAGRFVQDFADKHRDEWKAVEVDLPTYVALAKRELGDGAPAQDILTAALDKAVFANPELRAKRLAAAAQKAAPVVDPQRAEAAIRAKSVNVAGKPASPRAMTEDEAMEAIWRKHHGSQ
jgi:hypothetical protein